MFDFAKFEEMTPYESFQHWFTRIGDGAWKVEGSVGDGVVVTVYEGRDDTYHVSAGKFAEVGQLGSMDITLPQEVASSILDDFIQFKNTRPEYIVGRPIEVSNSDMERMVDIYETLIVGVAFLRARRNGQVDPDKVYNKIEPCLQWIRNSGFYNGPASSVYHESCPGGLLTHTLNVVNKIYELLKVQSFDTVHVADATLVALVHDWCKIDQYESYMRNQKNEATGAWEKVPAYRRKDAMLPLGHGVASLFIASRFFKLSTEESLAVRWHMGAWRVHKDEMDELQSANETFPMVHLLQFADQLSIVSY